MTSKAKTRRVQEAVFMRAMAEAHASGLTGRAAMRSAAVGAGPCPQSDAVIRKDENSAWDLQTDSTYVYSLLLQNEFSAEFFRFYTNADSSGATAEVLASAAAELEARCEARPWSGWFTTLRPGGSAY